VDSFTLRPLYPRGKILWYPLDRELGGPQSRNGRRENRKISCPYREWNPSRASLYRLSYPGSYYRCRMVYYFMTWLTGRKLLRCGLDLTLGLYTLSTCKTAAGSTQLSNQTVPEGSYPANTVQGCHPASLRLCVERYSHHIMAISTGIVSAP
jgi:hypothetical protein